MYFKKGVSLLELLIVLAILSVLIALVFFTIRPDDILFDTRKSERQSKAQDLEKAIQAYKIDNKGELPAALQDIADGTYSICKYAEPSCPPGSIDLDILVDSKYIPELPETNDCEITGDTCFNITISGEKSLTVIADVDLPPNYHLVYAWGDTGYDLVRDVKVDSNDNLFVAGRFNGNVDFDNTSGTDIKSSQGGDDVFLTKYNADGSYGWTKTIGAQTADTAEAIAFDSQNNIYVAGYVGGTATIDFNPDAGVDNKSVGPDFDAFVTKMNADGTYGWTQKIGATNSQYGFAIDVDNNGNIYLAGEFDGTVDFNPFAGTDNITSNGSWDTFLTKINNDLTYGYTYRFGNTGSNEHPYDVSIDGNNNVFLAHTFPGTFDMDPTGGTDNKTATGVTDLAVTKINANGTYGWTYAVGGSSPWGEEAHSIDFDASDNIYILGVYGDAAVDFDHGAGTTSRTATGTNDIFTVKLNSNGTFAWVNTVGGSNIEYAESIKVKDNAIYLTGSFNNSNVDFNPTGGTDLKSPAGDYDNFISKYNTDGTYVYTYTLGSTGEDLSAQIDVDSNNNLVVTGVFNGTIDFDLTSGVSNKVSNGDDIFLIRTNGQTF